jgi:hypothetical protein
MSGPANPSVRSPWLSEWDMTAWAAFGVHLVVVDRREHYGSLGGSIPTASIACFTTT